MTVAELVHKYDALGVQLWLDNRQLRFRAPAGVLNEQCLQELRFHKEALIRHLNETEDSIVTADLANRYAPFPLTDIQAAYLIGRKNDYELGGVGCHGYVELTMPVLDRGRLEQAWHSVIARHDMLRAMISTKGYQQVLKEFSLLPVKAQDLRGENPAQVQAAIQKVRTGLSTRQYQPDQWPLYELFLTTTDQNSIMHFSIDMLIADFVSISVILAELDHLYHHPEKPLSKPEVAYRDILLFQQAQQKQPARRAQRARDRQYWLERIDQMPEAPDLPMAECDKTQQKVSFERYGFRLAQRQWNSLCQQSKGQKITPSGVVLAAFAGVIGKWSRNASFCINITILNRPELHPQIDRIVGDFTTVNVLEVSPKPGSSFFEQAQALQQRLWQDLEHGSFSGIEVLRELRRRRNKSVIIPVVYTSTIGAGSAGRQDGEFLRGASLTYGISQTPQVWIDCQVAERFGELHVNWDVRSGIFPAGMIEAAFAAFAQLLQEMAGSSERVWEN
ncbi:condensation domain-containing protein [Sporomusa sp. KB1]|jgi:pyochelin synthetase|uniref:condensation domain-containing protein n=1 Tax=Sporomusa sp. KB1 TaxID=943346 RepID=UPI0011A5FF2E|nr:condensation domain-containing protein [Sporomusa sp. KB1]TWH46109.1 Non-ribosomal peptide synthetase modules and related proteins [Sporomusa sp. KB1]